MQQQDHKHSLTLFRWRTPAWERISLGSEMEKSKFLGDTCPSALQARSESLHRFLYYLSLPHCQESGLTLGRGLSWNPSFNLFFPVFLTRAPWQSWPHVPHGSCLISCVGWNHLALLHGMRVTFGPSSLPRTQSLSAADREHTDPGFLGKRCSSVSNMVCNLALETTTMTDNQQGLLILWLQQLVSH